MVNGFVKKIPDLFLGFLVFGDIDAHFEYESGVVRFHERVFKKPKYFPPSWSPAHVEPRIVLCCKGFPVFSVPSALTSNVLIYEDEICLLTNARFNI